MATAIPFFSCKRPKSHNWHHSDLAWMDRPQTPTITWRYWPARKKWKEGVGLWAFQKLLMATYPTYPTNLFIYYIYTCSLPYYLRVLYIQTKVAWDIFHQQQWNPYWNCLKVESHEDSFSYSETESFIRYSVWSFICIASSFTNIDVG